jgi:hypothetical protein
MTVVVGILVDLVGPMVLGFVVWALLTSGAGLMLFSSLLALPVSLFVCVAPLTCRLVVLLGARCRARTHNCVIVMLRGHWHAYFGGRLAYFLANSDAVLGLVSWQGVRPRSCGRNLAGSPGKCYGAANGAAAEFNVGAGSLLCIVLVYCFIY